MNATELAKMLEGWPKSARPLAFPYAPPFDIEGIPTAGYSLGIGEDRFGDELSQRITIDLACMSGLRWLIFTAKGGCAIGETVDGRVYLELLDPDLGWGETLMSTSGPTLLHAIDAAIKATKGNQ